SWNENVTSCFCALFSRTRFACGMTSVPTPSPAITAIVKVFMAPNLIVAGTILGADDAGLSARAAWKTRHARLSDWSFRKLSPRASNRFQGTRRGHQLLPLFRVRH